MCNPGKLPELRCRATDDSICIRNTANFVDFRPINLLAFTNCTIIYQQHRQAPGKRENFPYSQQHLIDASGMFGTIEKPQTKQSPTDWIEMKEAVKLAK